MSVTRGRVAVHEDLLRLVLAAKIERHGSLREAARALGVDHVYLWRLSVGQRNNPSAALLKKLGLRRIVGYVYEVKS